MTDIATLNAYSASLRAALASGALRVRSPDGREVQYQTSDQLLRAIAAVDGEIAAASQTPPPRMRRVVTVRDF